MIEKGPDISVAVARLSTPTIEDIVRRLNELTRFAALDLAYAVGGLIIAELFEGSVALWGRDGTRRPSYRQLAAHPDLLISQAALCRAVGIYVLCERQGGRSSWPHLSVSHMHEVLVLEPAHQDRLLQAAESERWTVRRLRNEVDKQRRKRKRGNKHFLERSAKAVTTFVAAATERLKNQRSLGHLSKERQSELQQVLVELRKDVERVESLLDSAQRNAKRKGDP